MATTIWDSVSIYTPYRAVELGNAGGDGIGVGHSSKRCDIEIFSIASLIARSNEEATTLVMDASCRYITGDMKRCLRFVDSGIVRTVYWMGLQIRRLRCFRESLPQIYVHVMSRKCIPTAAQWNRRVNCQAHRV